MGSQDCLEKAMESFSNWMRTPDPDHQNPWVDAKKNDCFLFQGWRELERGDILHCNLQRWKEGVGLCSGEVRREFWDMCLTFTHRYKILFDPGWLPAAWQRKPTFWAALGAQRMSSYWKGEFGQPCCYGTAQSKIKPWYKSTRTMKVKVNGVGKSEMSI